MGLVAIAERAMAATFRPIRHRDCTLGEVNGSVWQRRDWSRQ